MRQLKNLSLIVLGILVAMSSCKKTKDIVDPQIPLEPDTASFLQLTAPGIPASATAYFAVFSMESKTGEPIFSNKKVALNYVQGLFKTDKLPVNKGEFRLTKFIVVKSSDTAIYAAPLAGSAKAGQVTKPLTHNLVVNQAGVFVHAAELLKINDNDVPANYGYNADDFGFNPFLTLKLKLKITVGDVIYDSLPSLLFIEATKGDNSKWNREIDLSKGVSAFSIPDDFDQYKFKISKWNLTFEKNLNRGELSNNQQLDFEAARLTKKLVKETTYLELSTGLREDSRTEYFYAAAGKLSDINYFQRLPQYAELQPIHKYKFVYSGNILDTIKRFSPDQVLNGFTAFSYTGGKISSIHNKSFDQQTFAAVAYTGTAANPKIEIDYLFSNGNSMNYKMNFSGGNKTSDIAQTSTGGSQSGTYEYDSNINPYHQMGYPDLYLSNSSKNNRLIEQGNYAGAYPSTIPYKYEYSYDADGYPTALYISYKGYTSGQHLYRTKKVFQYQ